MNPPNWPLYPDTPPPPPLPDESSAEQIYDPEAALAYQLLHSFGVGETAPRPEDAVPPNYNHFFRPTADNSGTIHDAEVVIPGTGEHVKVVTLQSTQQPQVPHVAIAFIWGKGKSEADALAAGNAFLVGPEGILSPLPGAEGSANMAHGAWQEHAKGVEQRIVTALSSCNLMVNAHP